MFLRVLAAAVLLATGACTEPRRVPSDSSLAYWMTVTADPPTRGAAGESIEHMMLGYRRVQQTRGALLWIGFAACAPGDFTWPRGRRIFLTLADSSVVQDSISFVMGPMEVPTMEQRPYPQLGSRDLKVPRDQLWQKVFPGTGEPEPVVFAGFPLRRVQDAADVVYVRCRDVDVP